jgi:ornithine cyclodeaminase/alanine dehydrogenase
VKADALLLSLTDVKQCLSMAQAVAIVEQVFLAHGKGKVVMPAKIKLDMTGLGIPNWMNAMPAYVEPAGLYGLKFAGGFVNNPSQHDLPYVMGSMMLFDPHTGVLVAVMEAEYITSMRTGATAGVAARYLARRDSSIVTFIGCGVQAGTSLEALDLVTELREIRAVDVNPEASERLVRQAREMGIVGRAVGGAQEAVEGADIIVVATTAAGPQVMKDWVKPGAFVAKLGSYQELDDALTLSADKLIVDHREQAEHKGELAHLFEGGRITQEDVYSEIGDVVAAVLPGREHDDEIIIAAMIGMGTEDVGVGAAVLRRARELGLGHEFDFSA